MCQTVALRVVWVLGCCAYLVHLLLSLTGCLASPVSTSWTPSLTTCCPERGGVCWDAGQRKVGVCWWSPLSLRLPSKITICSHSSLLTSHVSVSLTAKSTCYILHLQSLQRPYFERRNACKNAEIYLERLLSQSSVFIPLSPPFLSLFLIHHKVRG